MTNRSPNCQVSYFTGKPDMARFLLPDYGSDVDACEMQSWTPLHVVSRYGYLDLARLLIDRGADVNSQKENHWTALHLASHKGHLDIAKVLIDPGADVDTLTAGMTSWRLPWPWCRGLGTLILHAS
jgi:ankyrin repeat protein